MDHRRLGRTGFKPSVIGFGAFKIGRNVGIKYPSGYDLPDDAEAIRIVHGMLETGINYIDTAPAYGLSEKRIGKALQQVDASDVFVSTKVGETFVDGESSFEYSEDAVRNSVENSCRLLGRDPLDIVFVHSNGDDLHIQNRSDCVRTLQALRDAGRIRAIGFSGKTPEGAEAALSWADAIMVTYHEQDRSHEDVIEKAAQHGLGVVVKKGLASGHLEPHEAIRFVLSNPNVTSMVIGGLNPQHMAENVRIAEALRVSAT